MRRVLLVILIMMLAAAGPAATAQMTYAGTQEIGLSGLVDFDTASGTLIHLSMMYGFFAADGVELGGQVGVTDDDNHTVWRAAGIIEYDYDLGMELVPYVGARCGVAKYEVEATKTRKSRDDFALLLGGTAGAKYFIAENVAVDIALNLEWASEDIYPSDDGFENTDARVTLGLRFFF
ncbi:MAG: hypothetical protein DRP22_04415 [Verrucomicrobia bacterium]|nr:MAG: hypothetical protein DRP22_04415 [Verrucomicrobiota bacterium]